MSLLQCRINDLHRRHPRGTAFSRSWAFSDVKREEDNIYIYPGQTSVDTHTQKRDATHKKMRDTPSRSSTHLTPIYGFISGSLTGRWEFQPGHVQIPTVESLWCI